MPAQPSCDLSSLELHARLVPGPANASQPPLLILHGLLGSSDNWQSLGKRYALAQDVWMLDARNHGKSPHHPEHSYEHMVADLRAFMDLHGMPKADLLGHSMGGKTVMAFAEAHPGMVNKLIVADIATKAYTPHHGPIFDALLQTSPDRATSRESVQDDLARALGDDKVLVPFLMKGLHRLKEGGFAWRFNVPVLSKALDDVVGEVSVGMNTLPTLIIRGSESPYVSDEDLLAMEGRFLNMTDHTIEGAGHWLHAESPEEFFEVTSDFLA